MNKNSFLSLKISLFALNLGQMFLCSYIANTFLKDDGKGLLIEISVWGFAILCVLIYQWKQKKSPNT